MTLSLTVNWSTASTLPKAGSWFDWSSAPYFDPDPLESSLNWPPGTISALRFAFHSNLSRATEWKIGNHPQPQSIMQAAQVFRRGAPLMGNSNLPSAGSYSIDFVDHWELDPRSFAIIEKKVALLWDLSSAPQSLIVDINERTKTLATIASLKLAFLAQSKESEDPVVIIGGGVLADTAAFLTSLLHRPFILIPTTLLAMIDACVGGKTGVNFPPYGKNQIGHFAFPNKVVISKHWLKTLPSRELRAGMSEAFKHAVIKGDKHLAKLAAKGSENLAPFTSYLLDYVKVKKSVVEIDPMELGLRSVLNFGHTLAHAIEAVSHERSHGDYILHGEAVGVGLLFAIYLSYRLSHLKKDVFLEMYDLLIHSNFLIKPDFLRKLLVTDDLADDTLISSLMSSIYQDKKNESRFNSMWILVEDWGKFVNLNNKYTTAVSHENLVRVYQEFIKNWEAQS